MAPVGSYESLRAAVAAGADSVYFGVGKLNMRSRSAANFTLDDLARIVEIARQYGIKTYLTVNTILYDDELETMHAVVDRALREGVDAVIASDQAAILYARSVGMEVHISTCRTPKRCVSTPSGRTWWCSPANWTWTGYGVYTTTFGLSGYAGPPGSRSR